MYDDMRTARPRCDFPTARLLLLSTWVLALFLVGAAPAPKRISLDVKDAELHNVLRLLADTGRVNIVVPDDVKGKVTIKLRNVPWTEALDVILRSKGLGREQQGGVIQVDTLERIVKRQRDQAELSKLAV